MQQNYQSGDACCFTSRGPGMDPTMENNVVMAGEVTSDGTCGYTPAGGCPLATVYFPSQTYRAGYCPGEALMKGTLFPELVFERVMSEEV
jgi:hypothetical protein